MEDNEGEEVEMVLGRMVNKNLQLDSSTEQSWIPDFVDTLGWMAISTTCKQERWWCWSLHAWRKIEAEDLPWKMLMK
jgi:hypothetical protein